MKNFVPLFLALSVSTAFADSSLKGVIREADCNQPSGLGVLQIEQVVGDDLVVRSVRVNSMALCGSDGQSMTRLASIGYDALFLAKPHLYSIIIRDGFATSLKDEGEIDYAKSIRNATRTVQIGRIEADAWFLSGPANIPFGATNLEDLIEKYTRN